MITLTTKFLQLLAARPSILSAVLITAVSASMVFTLPVMR